MDFLLWLISNMDFLWWLKFIGITLALLIACVLFAYAIHNSIKVFCDEFYVPLYDILFWKFVHLLKRSMGAANGI